jgi:hypothetical protein
MRTAIHTALASQWAEEQQRMLSYDKPFALVALGGTGREEVTPCSDLDFAFLFDDALEGNALLLELQRQMLHTSPFEERHGFSCIALPFGVRCSIPAVWWIGPLSIDVPDHQGSRRKNSESVNFARRAAARRRVSGQHGFSRFH